MCLVEYISDNGIYKVYDPTNGKFSSARDIIFDEKRFFTSEELLANTKKASQSSVDDDDDDDDDDDAEIISFAPPHPSPIIYDEIIVTPGPPPTVTPESTPEDSKSVNDDDGTDEGNDDTAPEIRQSHRSRKTRTFYGRGGTPVREVRQVYISMTECLALEPQSYEEAISGMDAQKWRNAMDRELHSIQANHTWDIVNANNVTKRPIGSRWVYHIKNDGRYKARLVARGFTEAYGVDYLDTYAPVVKATTLRILFTIAAYEDWEIDQMDVDTAYLNSSLPEGEVLFMEMPQ